MCSCDVMGVHVMCACDGCACDGCACDVCACDVCSKARRRGAGAAVAVSALPRPSAHHL